MAMIHVTEGFCPLCKVALVVHADRGCCPCGGCSYRVGGGQMQMLSSCELHPTRDCEHWKAVWKAADLDRS